MKNIVSKLIGVGLFVSLTALPCFPLQAADDDAPTRKPRGTPYAGKISAVDRSAKTVTLSTKNEKTRVYHILADTRLTLGTGEKATFEDAKVGEEAAAYGHQEGDKYIAQSLRIGPKPGSDTDRAPQED